MTKAFKKFFSNVSNWYGHLSNDDMWALVIAAGGLGGLIGIIYGLIHSLS